MTSLRGGAVRSVGLIAAATVLIAATYGLVRLAYGLHLPDTQRDLGFDAAVAGTISAGASIAYCVGAVAGFLLAARYARTLVVLAGATAALGSIGIAVSPSLALFAPAAVLASAGAGLASPALVRIVQRSLRARAVPAAQTAVNAGTGPGLVAAGLIALLLLPEWRAAWWVAAAVSALAAVAVLSLDGRGAGPSSAVLPSASWYRAHRLVIVAALAMGAASAAVWNLGRTLLSDAGVAETVSVLAWVALGVGGLAVIPAAGMMNALRARTAWMLTTAALALATAALVLLPEVTAISWAACAVFGWGYTGATGALIAWTSEIDPERAAGGTAMLFVTLVFGQAVGAAAAGVALETFDYGPVFLAAAVLAAVSASLGLRRSVTADVR